MPGRVDATGPGPRIRTGPSLPVGGARNVACRPPQKTRSPTRCRRRPSDRDCLPPQSATTIPCRFRRPSRAAEVHLPATRTSDPSRRRCHHAVGLATAASPAPEMPITRPFRRPSWRQAPPDFRQDRELAPRQARPLRCRPPTASTQPTAASAVRCKGRQSRGQPEACMDERVGGLLKVGSASSAT